MNSNTFHTEMDCSTTPAEGSSGYQSQAVSNWASTAASVFQDYNSFPPVPQPQNAPAQRFFSRDMLPYIPPQQLLEDFLLIMSDDDEEIITNACCILFLFSIDTTQGPPVCKAFSASPKMMSRIYYVLTDQKFKNNDSMLCYAAVFLMHISNYREGRSALLSVVGVPQSNSSYAPGAECLVHSLTSKDKDVVRYAMFAIHKLLLDRELLDEAKKQIAAGQNGDGQGIKYIVNLLDHEHLRSDYEFRCIVLGCLQILAYHDEANKNAIMQSNGTYLVLRTIDENLNDLSIPNHGASGGLLETAFCVLKALSAGRDNRYDIIEKGGIPILTHCLNTNNLEILKSCLWTLRNLSDLINERERDMECKKELVHKLLNILKDYAEEPGMISCAICTLDNLTCNNEPIKRLICMYETGYNGVDLILNTMTIAFRDSEPDCQILEPAVCALRNIMNQSPHPNLDYAKFSIRDNTYVKMLLQEYRMFNHPNVPNCSQRLSMAIEKLNSLLE